MSRQQFIATVDLDMPPTQGDDMPRLPRFLQNMQKSPGKKVVYVPLNDMKVICNLKQGEKVTNSSNLVSMTTNHSLPSGEFRLEPLDTYSEEDWHGDTNDTARHEGCMVAGGSISDREMKPERMDSEEKHATTVPSTHFKLPDILDKDARKPKQGSEKRFQEKFEETVRIYQKTRARISELSKQFDREKQHHHESGLSPSGKKLMPLRRRHSRASHTQKSQRLDFRHLEPIDTPESRESRLTKSTDSMNQDMETLSMPSKQAVTLCEKPPRKRHSPIKIPKINTSLPSVTSSQTNTQPIQKMFMDSDYDQFSHSKLRRTTPRISTKTKQYDKKEFINVRISQDTVKHLDDDVPMTLIDNHSVICTPEVPTGC